MSQQCAHLPVDHETRTLIIRARTGDAGAVDELFQRHRERLRSALRKILGEPYRRTLADSEDAVQDGLLQALSRLDEFEYRGKGSFLAWLLKSAEFAVQTKLRAATRKKRHGGKVLSLDSSAAEEPHDDATSPVDRAAAKELECRIRSCLDRLPAHESEVIMLRRYLGLTTKEICSELNLPSEGAVRALLSRAQTHMAELLAKQRRLRPQHPRAT